VRDALVHQLGALFGRELCSVGEELSNPLCPSHPTSCETGAGSPAASFYRASLTRIEQADLDVL
jgi:hypothetical protein